MNFVLSSYAKMQKNQIKNPYETIVQEMVDRVDISVDSNTKREFRKMLLSYKDILSTSEYDLWGAIGVLHKIETVDTKPLKQALCRQPINHQKALDNQVREMLELKVKRPSHSALSSNVVLVKEKDGKLEVLYRLSSIKRCND